MSFETGGDVQDPFGEEEEDESEGEVQDPFDEDVDTEVGGIEESESSEREQESREVTEPTTTESGTEDRTAASTERNDTQPMTNTESKTQVPESTQEVSDFSDIDLSAPQSPQELADLLMAEGYHSENPPVSYAMWRDGTSTGRSRTTIELNGDVDTLVKQAQQEFESRYDAEINKADLREFAMVVGLTNLESVFEIAESWGLQYNN